MTYRGLIGAVLYANYLRRLVDFYTSVAAVEAQTIEQGHAILGGSPSRLVIVRIPKRIADQIDITTPPELRDATPIKLVFAVEDIAQARDRAVRLGGALNAVEREWEFEGAKVCDGHDPEGNVFQFRQMG